MRYLLLLLRVATAPAAPTVSLPNRGAGRVGEPAPWFSGWTFDDRVLNRDRLLESAPGGVALVVFATWCVPCTEGLKRLAKGREALEERGVKAVLIAYREDVEVVKPWLAERGWGEGTVLIDRFGVAATALGVASKSKEGERARLPRTFVVAGDGTVRAILGREGDDYVERILQAARAPR